MGEKRTDKVVLNFLWGYHFFILDILLVLFSDIPLASNYKESSGNVANLNLTNHMAACYIPNTVSFQLIPFNSNNQTQNCNGFLLYISVLGCVCLSKMMIFKHLSNREESKMKNQMG